MAEHHELIIIGSGPAGFTAALYAGRGNLDVIIFEGYQPGGQLMITTEVENYPGFEHGIKGPEMMDIFRNQAHRFGAKSIYEAIGKVDFSSRPFRLWTDSGTEYTSDAVIISTELPPEPFPVLQGIMFTGGEVFRPVLLVTASSTRTKRFSLLEGGIQQWRKPVPYAFWKICYCDSQEAGIQASKIMVDRARKNPKISFLLDSVIDEFMGKEMNGFPSLTGINIKNV